ncbi:MAG: universal stress protein [Phycisphaerales bacterium]|nr:MAG: universal stress protein [Phycisphaerales bacterium]
MLTHVLIAVDFSPATPRLIARLRALRTLGAKEATLVHVLSTRYPSAPAETHRAEYEDRLKQIADEIDPDITVHTRIETGEPGYELVQTAENVGADLILAGKRGSSRWRELFLGSTALDLARLTDRPLWLEPIGPDDEAPTTAELRHILLATDGSDAATPAEAMFAQLSGEFQRAIALHVVATSNDHEKQKETCDAERAMAALAEQINGLDTTVIDGDPSAVIAETAQREAIDLIVVGKRGRSSIQDLLLGSTAEAVCRRGQRSVLLVPGPRA